MKSLIFTTILAITSILSVGEPQVDIRAIDIPKQPLEANFEPLNAIVYAYTSREIETDSTPFITASGKRVREGIIACPRKYPFGTKFIIKGKEYICEDRMNIRYENNELEVFDIWHSDLESARQWGKQKLKVLITNK